ncbi:hypothetical protein QQF64_035684 [Cirrhinus molitorella]|uniref:Uncharacterized protein n=1 Tax=Cirrhinus molitorella TaxID=172907 RepID=A0ABR3NGX7_9TELE
MGQQVIKLGSVGSTGESGRHPGITPGGVGETHQAGCASEGSDGPRHATERVYADFQPSIAYKVQLPSQQNPCQPFSNETGVAWQMPMTRIRAC